MTPTTPLHRALADWRAAERRLEAAGADDPARPALEAEIVRLRARYQALFDEVEDVAGHGAPYADDAEISIESASPVPTGRAEPPTA